ncbi:hypothetical protein BKI52_42595 [marine bacterium AO1-C]|nr:hypothetical protein BKI52_42595 [marine bacterium AO1-C]
MKKNNPTFLGALITFLLITQVGFTQITINGKVSNPSQAKTVMLYQIDFENNKHSNIGNFKIDHQGNFKIETGGGEELYQLYVGSKLVWLALMPGEKVDVIHNEKNEFTVNGSKSTNELRAFEAFYKKWEGKLSKIEFKLRLQKFVDKMVTPLAVYGSKSYWYNEDDDFFEKTTKRLLSIDKDCKSTQRMVGALKRLKKVTLGAIAPEISLENPQGQVINLTSLRGKYVLVDFWASWCKPCRAENPAIVNAFQKYKNKGFTVYGVSLDRKKAPWLKAIKKDHLNWTHVTDFKFWSTPVAKTYSVSQLPSNFLLDPSGKIIAKSLKGKALEKKLAEIFGK